MTRARWCGLVAAIFGFGSLWGWALFGISEPVAIAASMTTLTFAAAATMLTALGSEEPNP